MATRKGKQALTLLLGQCVPSMKENAAKIRVKKLDFDAHLNMYFNKHEYLYAHDPEKLCKTGDTVLVQSLPSRLTRIITHKVVNVIYPLGDITDPITGKKSVVSKYRDDIKRVHEIYGKSENAFDYDKRPPRGSQEGKLDFSHKEGYVKYHEDPDDPQTHAVH
ncbi:uncharacterized protein LOC107267375 [Cephus cinctus]|uniref:Uncharacterized protein LOC107267375 n=1 Tax=Cephus cinctus TaxID=211228 RepID=A0AAJ7FJ78_CEPCN|nr:uncharacterized protein LOC107267375 [Cephus cinctus]